ncbi:hypothetical protein GSI_09522 [Ganoderma sinense ZZ0214-1]|uniref:Uncharacterized protein n=1 Tax=Ganoderma sinense ZZ0214-1 TaxID=1077348 RepID=A0A2G8S3N2_9APHY|nr:hypothetical protein GSI_09522 [Ganoderma sinense ZZ0214-1]
MAVICSRDSTDSADTVGTLEAILTAALNEYGESAQSQPPHCARRHATHASTTAGFMFKIDPYMGEETVIYRVRDIDLRARRIDSNSATRSFGASMDLLRRASDHRQLPMTLDAILERTVGKDVAFALSSATDPVLARLLVIAGLIVYLISRMDALFVVHDAL